MATLVLDRALRILEQLSRYDARGLLLSDIARKSGIPLSVIARWFDASFGPEAATSAAPAAVVDEVRVAA